MDALQPLLQVCAWEDHDTIFPAPIVCDTSVSDNGDKDEDEEGKIKKKKRSQRENENVSYQGEVKKVKFEPVSMVIFSQN